MEHSRNFILQINDLFTTRVAALRIDSGDAQIPVGELLDKYLKRVEISELVQSGRVAQRSADILFSMQDLVYTTDDNGKLLDMFSGIAVKQGETHLDLKQMPVLQSALVNESGVSVIDLTIDRTDVGYQRNWCGVHRRRWDRSPDLYMGFVQEVLAQRYPGYDTEEILRLESTQNKLKLLKSLARRVWDSDFESYSRFSGNKLMYKSGDETVRNIMDGAGGICSEKVQALKFLTDQFGLQAEYLIAGDNAIDPVPVDKLREMLKTLDFRFSKRYMRYWQHTALLYHIDGMRVLVDATNGNIPFLFLKDGAAEGLLGYEDKVPLTVRMVESVENFYYHRVPQDIPEQLFVAMQGWIPDVDMMQVFDNELGLFLSRDFYVTPIPFVDQREFGGFKAEYVDICHGAKLEYSVSAQWDLDSSLGNEFAAASP